MKLGVAKQMLSVGLVKKCDGCFLFLYFNCDTSPSADSCSRLFTLLFLLTLTYACPIPYCWLQGIHNVLYVFRLQCILIDLSHSFIFYLLCVFIVNHCFFQSVTKGR